MGKTQLFHDFAQLFQGFAQLFQGFAQLFQGLSQLNKVFANYYVYKWFHKLGTVKVIFLKNYYMSHYPFFKVNLY